MTPTGNTEIQIDGIRELTHEEINAVAGGLLGNGNNSLFSCLIQVVICKIQQFLSCFGNYNTPT